MLETFKGKELSIGMLNILLEESKMESMVSKYKLLDADARSALAFVNRNKESIYDVYKIYTKLTELDNDKSIASYGYHLEVFKRKGNKMDLDYFDDSPYTQGINVLEFMEECLDVPFEIDYKSVSIKNIIEEIGPAFFTDELWDCIMDYKFDTSNSNNLEFLGDEIFESSRDNGSCIYDSKRISEFNEKYKDKLEFCYSNKAVKRIEEVEEGGSIDMGCILYYSDNIDEFIEKNRDNPDNINKLLYEMSYLSNILTDTCVCVTDLKMVENHNKFVPTYVRNKYVFIQMYYAVGSAWSRSGQPEDYKTVSMSNSYFYLSLIDSIGNIRKVLEPS